MRAIRTIGYEGTDIEAFLAALKQIKADLVLDIREFPISRKRGFSKKALSSRLNETGIAYRHEPVLGSPKPIRDKLRATGDYNAFFRAYDKHLRDNQGTLEMLVSELKGTIALLCFERDHNACHRKSVARELAALTGKEPKHIGVQPPG